MAVKHTSPQGEVTVHKGRKGGKTGCGFDTTTHPGHWEDTRSSITCKKDGCR